MTLKLSYGLALGAGALTLMASFAQADQVFNDDVIITQSLCVGNDCVNGESFGFDTIRLKENNLRINFTDTSNSASFPTTDWEIEINSSSNGGGSYFRVDDITNSRSPFSIEAASPTNSLYVEDGGRIGFGTSTPVVNLHVVEGNTPTLRLEQDGSQGFTAQTWDVAGNETNFFVRDTTNGSRLPFKIKPSAPTNALFIDSDGDIGLGTQNPNALNANNDLVIQSNGPARIALVNTQATNQDWTINSNNTLRIGTGADSAEFQVTELGDILIEGVCMQFDTEASSGGPFACTFGVGAPSCVAGNCP